jgi:hypothetical protein
MHHLIWILWIALGSAFLSAISFWLMSMVAKDLEVGNVWVPKDPTHPLCGVEFVITSLNGKWVTISYQWGGVGS